MARQEVKEEESEVSVAAPVAPPAQPSPWPPLIVAIIVMPLLSYGMTHYLLIPNMKDSLTKSVASGASTSQESEKPSPSDAKKGKEERPTTFDYAFDNIVVNVSGTKGTRYLKASFTVFSSNSELKNLITRRRSELLNLTLNILSSKTMNDLETPGAKSVLLGELQENFNHTLNSSLVEQIFFSEFVIQ